MKTSEHKESIGFEMGPRATRKADLGSRTGMPGKGEVFAGCAVAMVTPFRDGGVDFEALRCEADWLISQGVPTLCPAGTTGEAPTLTRDEHDRVISTVVEQAGGRAKVLAGPDQVARPRR